MPLLVYVSREKRPSYPHHFKAGALNALVCSVVPVLQSLCCVKISYYHIYIYINRPLHAFFFPPHLLTLEMFWFRQSTLQLRVSGIMSNSPYVLGLDCDMYSSDPSSARQAMCFHMDPELSRSLAFVQFPQRFRNISRNDIYDSKLRVAFWVRHRHVMLFVLRFRISRYTMQSRSGTFFRIKIGLESPGIYIILTSVSICAACTRELIGLLDAVGVLVRFRWITGSLALRDLLLSQEGSLVREVRPKW